MQRAKKIIDHQELRFKCFFNGKRVGLIDWLKRLKLQYVLENSFWRRIQPSKNYGGLE